MLRERILMMYNAIGTTVRKIESKVTLIFKNIHVSKDNVVLCPR